MAYDRDSIEMAALEKARTFVHLSNSVRPSVVCVLRIGRGNAASSFVGESSNQNRVMQADVATMYTEVPAVYQSLNHGRCAEADALSKALNRGFNTVDLRGSECQSVIPAGLRLVPPCQSCTQVLRRLGVRFTGDVSFNPVLAEIVARGI